MAKTILFIHAYWQRCGNNYLSGLLKTIHDGDVPVDDISEFPFPHVLSDFYTRTKSLRNKSYSKYMLECVSQGLTNEIKNRALSDFVIIKNTIAVDNLKDFISHTPDEKHFLLLRDPRDVAYSYFASMKRSLSSSMTVKNLIKRFLLSIGYYHYRVGRRIKERFVTFNELHALNSVTLLRYEDLLDINPSIVRLLNDNREVDVSKLSLLRNLPVYNTSFKEEIGAEKTWAHNTRTSGFKPKGRWQNSRFIHYFILTRILFPKSFLSRYNY